MTEIKIDIDEFCNRVMNTHNSHYINNPSGLIDLSKNASPNENQIFHLYSNGEITYQKGAWAYGKRSEFNIKNQILGARKFPFKFVIDSDDNTSYAILTEEECFKFREEMKQIIINK